MHDNENTVGVMIVSRLADGSESVERGYLGGNGELTPVEFKEGVDFWVNCNDIDIIEGQNRLEALKYEAGLDEVQDAIRFC